MRTNSEQRTHTAHTQHVAVVALASIAIVGVAGGHAVARPVNTLEASAAVAPSPVASHSEPRLLVGAVADVIVRLSGSVCSGTPITGTVYVVTAAHCVLTEGGEVTQRTVVRDHVRYPAAAVLVDTRYHEHPSEALDVAVLIMSRAIPGRSVRVGVSLPDNGAVTLAGFQPIGTDGSLLRGARTPPQTRPKGATGERTPLPYRPAGCAEPVDALDVSAARVIVPCGLVPGASGGGLYAEEHGELVLVGIISTVTADQTANGVVPLASVHELLEHTDRYAHGFDAVGANNTRSRTERP